MKAAAEKATPGEWVYFPKNTSIEYDVGSDESQGSILYVDSGDFTQVQTDRNGEFIALANPANILALVEALEKAQQRIASQREYYEGVIADGGKRIAELDRKNCELDSLTQRWAVERAENADRIAELESRAVTVKPEDADGVREEGNQFLVVRHPGKVPVIKHPVGQLEDYLLQILKADPLATIDIVTHRYYGAGGQFVKDADEYLHEMGIKREAE
ncbi:TPA: ead/Ea22-like family protein [Klebsiella pneumoniae]